MQKIILKCYFGIVTVPDSEPLYCNVSSVPSCTEQISHSLQCRKLMNVTLKTYVNRDVLEHMKCQDNIVVWKLHTDLEDPGSNSQP